MGVINDIGLTVGEMLDPVLSGHIRWYYVVLGLLLAPLALVIGLAFIILLVVVSILFAAFDEIKHTVGGSRH